MPKRIEPRWIEQAKLLKAKHPAWGAGRIARELCDLSGQEELVSEPTVRTWLKNYVPPPDYAPVTWPDSFGEGKSLPWEAGVSVMELLRNEPRRPALRMAKWFWRVSLATPAASYSVRYFLAKHLVIAETFGTLDHVGPQVEQAIKDKLEQGIGIGSPFPLGQEQLLFDLLGIPAKDEALFLGIPEQPQKEVKDVQESS